MKTVLADQRKRRGRLLPVVLAAVTVAGMVGCNILIQPSPTPSASPSPSPTASPSPSPTASPSPSPTVSPSPSPTASPSPSPTASPSPSPSPSPTPAPTFNNTTDRSNGNAEYIGSATCAGCHPGIDAQHNIHGHAHKLTAVSGAAPQFPQEGTRAGVPNPPEGFDWDDVSYVIGGYTKKARFIDQDGYILITGLLGIPTQWNLAFPPNGTQAGFVNYESERMTQKPYDYSCFVCHTTGPLPLDEDFPVFQEDRPGFAGTWEEPGVRCEACHGPGSRHAANPPARDLYVDTGSTTCAECHNRPFNADGTVIQASGGYIQHHEQYPELVASGGHADFNCTTCHEPHVSVLYDRANALKQECTDCHDNADMAGHEGATFVRGDYTEEVSCDSCHMPYATRSGSTATAAVVGDSGRMGDTKTHIFRINPANVNYTGMFSEDLSQVVHDAEGRSAVTLDFVCLRCHNGIGNAFALTVQGASGIAPGLHGD